jgi:lipopolysaccharide/colanic/teichoic acid biosynthesis glycosyltransferase
MQSNLQAATTSTTQADYTWHTPYEISSRLIERSRTHNHTPTGRSWYRYSKRGGDLIAATILLIVLFPIFLLVSLAVKISSPGPIIFRQERLTEGGRKFQLLKFRSMVVDAEQSSGATFASRRDPRVTPIGNFIRKTRLDELPQLVNILKGDMSLIGPRPERPELADTLTRSMKRFPQRLAAKAGITGLAQVVQGYPDDIRGYRRKLGLDLVYIRKQGFLLDAWIALKTIGVIISGLGAR